MGDDRYQMPPPKRLRTAYAYFVQETYHQVARELQVRRPQAVLVRLGEMWRGLKQDEREPFIQRALRDRIRYECAHSEWIRQQAGRPMGNMNRGRMESNGPKRSATAYVLFRREMSDRLREQMPEETAREREREVIRRWRELGAPDREKYQEKASEEKVRFVQDTYVWRQQEQERAAEAAARQEAAPAPAEGQRETPGADPADAPGPAPAQP